MSNRAKWLLIVLLGLMVHMNLLVFAKSTLQPFATSATFRANVLPFGQMNYEQVTNLATIEQLLLFVLWIVFAFILIRDRE